MTTASPPSSPIQSSGFLVLRFALGGIFIAHGLQKIFEYTLAGTAANFESMGIPAASFVAPAVAFLELVGGLMIVLGMFSRLFGVLLFLNMFASMLIVHFENGLWVDQGGWEYVAVLAAGLLAIVLAGPGRYALSTVILPPRLTRILG